MVNSNRYLEAKHMDIIRSLEYLAWTKKQHDLGRPQTDIDAHAFAMPHWFKGELTQETLNLFDDAIVEAFDCPRTGHPEECMTLACRMVIQDAAKDDIEFCLQSVSRKREIWRPIVESIRNKEVSHALWLCASEHEEAGEGHEP